jgi:hypothetical protein
MFDYYPLTCESSLRRYQEQTITKAVRNIRVPVLIELHGIRPLPNADRNFVRQRLVVDAFSVVMVWIKPPSPVEDHRPDCAYASLTAVEISGYRPDWTKD